MTASLTGAVACVAAADMDGGGGSGGGGGTVAGWTQMPLLDDLSSSARAVYHKGNDLVTGIHYESPDKGFIVSQGANETYARGGAVFKASASAVTAIAFSGDDTGLRQRGAIAFTGLERTPTGYIAMAYATDVIASHDGGATFTIQGNSNAERFGIEPVLAFQVVSAGPATGTTLVRETGVVTVSSTPPGLGAVYEDIWAPHTPESIPDPVPADVCQLGPRGTGTPVTRYSVYVSADRSFLAYTSNPNHHPEICISTDGGRTFYPHPLDVPESARDVPSTGVTFTSPATGIAWYASSFGGKYIKRTVDGGRTWSDVPFPRELAASQLQLPAGFFAPDGQHGWLAGYDHTSRAALLLATTDGGASWSRVSGVAEAVDAFHGDKLYSGFALDANHIWVGGARGLLMHN